MSQSHSHTNPKAEEIHRNSIKKSYTKGKKSVSFALAGNIFVTTIKMVAAAATGSATMFAESVHSFADTLNQSLLYIGLVRSKKPADSLHGYGYGIERFFWSLISACGILFIGAGVSVYHSINSLLENSGHDGYVFSYASLGVLIAALVIESITLYFALKELRGDKKWSREIFNEADPVTLSVVYEDSAAVLGVLVAIFAQWISSITDNGVYDAVGGIVVGLILGFLAVVLITKNYHYLIGKSLDEETKEKVIELLLEDSCIEHVTDFKSVAVDIGQYRIYATVEWNGSPLYEEIYEAGDLQEEFENIKDDFREFTKLMFKTTDRIPRLVGNRIDEIEKKIISAFPEISYVDIEIN